MDFSIFMEHAVTVYGPVQSARDTGAGTALTWPTVREANVACSLLVGGGSEVDLFGQIRVRGPVTVATYYTGVEVGDKLVVTVGDGLAGLSLHVTGIQVQPGMDFLAIGDLATLTCTQIQ